MEARNYKTICFGQFRLNSQKRLLFDAEGSVVPLMPKAFATLEFLTANAGRNVSKEELMDAVWGETAVEENNLNQCISAVRKALGEKPGENRFIVTIPGFGYEFVGEISGTDDPEHTTSEESQPAGDHWTRISTLASPRILFSSVAVLLLLAVLFVAARYFFQGSDQSATPASLAILPFRSLDASRADEALELGMTDALISRLKGGIDLPVSSFGAVRRFRSLETDPISAGRELGVEAVLDGSVQTTDERIRVSVRLVRTDNGAQIWFAKFDEELKDIFEVQDSIAERVAAALEIRLKPGQKGRTSGSPEAYQNYLKGRYVSFRLTLPNALKAIEYFETAIKIDPGFVPAYAGLADAYRSLVLTSDYPPREYMEKAKAAAEKALETDPSYSEAQTAAAFVQFWYLWDWEASEQHFKKAVDADGSNVITRAFFAHFLSNLGRHSEALAEVRRAKDLDPRNPLVNSIEGQILLHAGDLRSARERLAESIELDRGVFLSHLVMAKVLEASGEHDAAARDARKAFELSGGNAESLACAGYSLAKAGKRKEAENVRDELKKLAASKYVPPYDFAIIDLGLGDKQAALSNLEKAYEERNLQMVFLKVDPKWNELRDEPRFAELLKKLRFE